MLFQTTQAHEELRARIRAFAETEVKPIAFSLDQANEFPADAVKKLGEMGLMGIPYPKEYGGAGLDVFEQEPLPADHPLWQQPNVYITPHCTPQVPHRAGRSIEIIRENARRFEAGEPLLNLMRPTDAVTGEAHDRDIVLALDLQGFRDAGGKGGQAHKDSLNGGNAPASLIAAACQNGRATRRCHRDSLRTQNLQCRTANEFHGTALAGSQAFTQQIQFSHCCAPHFLSNRSRWVHHR